MISRAFVDNAKVMSKGQVTIPKDVRDVLGILFLLLYFNDLILFLFL